MNNLDPEVDERPEELVVYGGIGRAARTWECFDKIVETLKNLEADEALLIQSGKSVGVLKPTLMRHVSSLLTRTSFLIEQRGNIFINSINWD